MNDSCAIIITTINEKTSAIDQHQKSSGCSLILIGDKKSKPIESSDNLIFISVDDQVKLKFSFSEKCPFNHYARKNIGYLYAIKKGVEVIYDTDDDNRPLDDWFIPEFHSSLALGGNEKYINIYGYFTGKRVWPRGLPLSSINKEAVQVTGATELRNIAVWQGMANGDPDVDAIYRLVDNEPVIFDEKQSVHLDKGFYCPFNSQNTFWKKEFFPLLYLPSTTSFRFTDILRGYVAQRLIWDSDHYLGFMKATVFQDRNQHDYMNDFRDEVEVYLNVEKVVNILESVSLSGSLCDKLKIVYEELFKASIVKVDELELLDSWIQDYENIIQG